ncbi:hypothetical protein FPZ54_08210 [Sphingomonas suaedae]|uniref:Uncharacterized protein n=1 Tax=Sphingomonas suaedae TaxID=2599297 RepID=A0A518REW5_9SPHN|nr:hypothetical protein FPZ54_08210 [Sphingomonas suaedae]
MALSACGPTAKEPTLLEQEAAQENRVASLSGLDRVFEVPGAAIDAANLFDFQVGPYAPAQGSPAFRAIGKPVLIYGESRETGNLASFVATGSTAEQIDAVTFTLTIKDDRELDLTLRRFARVVRGYLKRFEIDGAQVEAAVEANDAAKGQLPEGIWELSRTPAKGNPDQLIVTFTRPGATRQSS